MPWPRPPLHGVQFIAQTSSHTEEHRWTQRRIDVEAQAAGEGEATRRSMVRTYAYSAAAADHLDPLLILPPGVWSPLYVSAWPPRFSLLNAACIPGLQLNLEQLWGGGFQVPAASMMAMPSQWYLQSARVLPKSAEGIEHGNESGNCVVKWRRKKPSLCAKSLTLDGRPPKFS